MFFMNRKTISVLIGLAGLLSATHSVHASTVNLSVSIQQTNDDGTLVSSGLTSKVWDLSGETWLDPGMDASGHELLDLVREDLKWKNSKSLSWGSAAEIYINDLKYDADPELIFDFTLNNNTAYNQTYSISYNTPLEPTLSGLINSSAYLTAVLTDVAGNPGAKIAPVLGNSKIMRSWDITSDQDLISKNVDIGTTFSIASGTATTNWSAVNTLVCGTGIDACETMSTVLTLTLSKGDKVKLSGKVEQIEAVPLPSSALLLGSMLALLGGMRRRREAV
jgi:hypothetical protein